MKSLRINCDNKGKVLFSSHDNIATRINHTVGSFMIMCPAIISNAQVLQHLLNTNTRYISSNIRILGGRGLGLGVYQREEKQASSNIIHAHDIERGDPERQKGAGDRETH